MSFAFSAPVVSSSEALELTRCAPVTIQFAFLNSFFLCDLYFCSVFLIKSLSLEAVSFVLFELEFEVFYRFYKLTVNTDLLQK